MRDVERLLYVVARLGFISIAIGLAIMTAALIPFLSETSASASIEPGEAYFIPSSLEPGATISINVGGEGLYLYVLKPPKVIRIQAISPELLISLPERSPSSVERPNTSPTPSSTDVFVGTVEQLDELLKASEVDVIANGTDALSLSFYSEEHCLILVVLANRGDRPLFGYWDIEVERRLVPPHRAVWFVGGFMGAGACMAIPWAYVELKKRKRP